MRAYRLMSLTAILGAAIALSACDASTPSRISTEKIRLKEQMVTQTLDAGRIDSGRLNVLADNIIRNGNGPVSLTVSYLSGDMAGANFADKQGDAYKKALAQRGVSNVSIITVPMTAKQYVGKAVVSYAAVVALPPKDCTAIPGSDGTENIEAMDHYQVGCNMKTEMSKMIADPSDLMGKDGTQDNDFRRAGATVEDFKAGKPNEQMKGFSASKIGTGG